MLGLGKLFKTGESRSTAAYSSRVEKINALEPDFIKLSDEELKSKTIEFKKRLADGETLDQILPEAFAAVREASKRTLGQRHFDVQLIGGMILHEGNIAEMKTGEGKTLVATLPVYLNALEGRGVHLVTVNDYLSRRDAVWMGQIYNALGLTTGVVNHDSSYLYDPSHKELDEKRDEVASFKVLYEFLRPVSRPQAYQADITYGTNNEFGFDYLRDNIEYDTGSLRQTNHHFAIVDEIDSILIDEARTPLIISAPTVDSENLYSTFADIARKLKQDEDYEVDEKQKAIQLKDSGIEKAEKILGVDNIYTDKGIKYVHHLETAVRAQALYKNETDYVVRDGEVIIVDAFTGRLQPGRRWSEGLHQAIEAKEGVEIQKESRTYASITFQNYFRLYTKLAGMTGTASTSAEEFLKVYGLDVFPVPTNKPVQRADQIDQIFQTEAGKFKAVAKRVKALHEKGQPVLIGTVSIEKNEVLSGFLGREGIPHQVLNAKNHEKEGEIIAEAGKKGAVTVATNMAGRGVDVKLGGAQASKEQSEEIKNIGGLFVLGTERHEARRIDNQLRGRSGRQGDPGATQFFVSLEDNLMRIFASDTIKSLMGRFGIPEDEPIENRMISRALESAQTKIEGLNFDARKHTLEYDDVLNTQRKSVYERRRKILRAEGDVLKTTLDEFLSEVLGKTFMNEAGEAQSNDGLRKIVDDKKAAFSEQEFYGSLKRLFLQTIDMFWIEHLEVMEYLRGSVNLRAYGQRDPLVEYKKEGLRLYKDMQESIDAQILSLIPGIGANQLAEEERKLREVQKKATLIGGSTDSAGKPRVALTVDKIGRNDKVTLIKDGKEVEVKFKKSDTYLRDGWIIKT
jgi:preprotein translocase subunit SecA